MLYGRASTYFYSVVFLVSTVSWAQPVTNPVIAVIGGGLAGLTTAYRLVSMGFNVVVYEAKNRLGGRIISIYIGENESCERVAELGGHNILDAGSAKNIRDLIEEQGLETIKSSQPVQLYHLDAGTISDPNSALKEFGCTPTSLKARINLICKRAATMHDVLKELFQDNELLYESFRIRLEDFEGDSVKNLSTSCVDSLYRFLIEELYSDPQSEEGDIRYETYLYVKGGNSLLIEALAEKLQGRIHLNKPLQAVHKTADEKYTLSFADGSNVQADIVILTMPCPVYADIEFGEEIFPVDRLEIIRSIRYGTNSKILVPVEPTEEEIYRFTNGRMIALRGGHENVATMYYIDGHGNFTDQTLKTTYEKDLPTLLMNSTISCFLDEPTVSTDTAFASYHGPVGYSWPSDPYAKGSYSYPSAGQEEAFTSLEIVEGEHVKSLFAPVDGTLFCAGEATSILLDSGGTMEAAVESGERTARLIGKIHTPAAPEVSDEK